MSDNKIASSQSAHIGQTWCWRDKTFTISWFAISRRQSFYPELPTLGIYCGCGKNLSICSHQARLRSHIIWTIATSCKIWSQFVRIRQDPDLPTSGKIMIYPHRAYSATSHRIYFGSAHFKQIWCWHDVLPIFHIGKTPFLPRSTHISKHLWWDILLSNLLPHVIWSPDLPTSDKFVDSLLRD